MGCSRWVDKGKVVCMDIVVECKRQGRVELLGVGLLKPLTWVVVAVVC